MEPTKIHEVKIYENRVFYPKCNPDPPFGAQIFLMYVTAKKTLLCGKCKTEYEMPFTVIRLVERLKPSALAPEQQ